MYMCFFLGSIRPVDDAAANDTSIAWLPIIKMAKRIFGYLFLGCSSSSGRSVTNNINASCTFVVCVGKFFQSSFFVPLYASKLHFIGFLNNNAQ